MKISPEGCKENCCGPGWGGWGTYGDGNQNLKGNSRHLLHDPIILVATLRKARKQQTFTNIVIRGETLWHINIFLV
jgi:hypothetical protein